MADFFGGYGYYVYGFVSLCFYQFCAIAIGYLSATAPGGSLSADTFLQMLVGTVLMALVFYLTLQRAILVSNELHRVARALDLYAERATDNEKRTITACFYPELCRDDPFVQSDADALDRDGVWHAPHADLRPFGRVLRETLAARLRERMLLSVTRPVH